MDNPSGRPPPLYELSIHRSCSCQGPRCHALPGKPLGSTTCFKLNKRKLETALHPTRPHSFTPTQDPSAPSHPKKTVPVPVKRTELARRGAFLAGVPAFRVTRGALVVRCPAALRTTTAWMGSPLWTHWVVKAWHGWAWAELK